MATLGNIWKKKNPRGVLRTKLLNNEPRFSQWFYRSNHLYHVITVLYEANCYTKHKFASIISRPEWSSVLPGNTAKKEMAVYNFVNGECCCRCRCSFLALLFIFIFFIIFFGHRWSPSMVPTSAKYRKNADDFKIREIKARVVNLWSCVVWANCKHQRTLCKSRRWRKWKFRTLFEPQWIRRCIT